jgi:hypothetical protein
VTRRRIEVITETDREIVFTQRMATVMFCRRCNEEASMVMPEYAAAQAAVSVRTVYRWIEAGNIHFVETTGGAVVICETSLADEISNFELRIADFSVEAWK